MGLPETEPLTGEHAGVGPRSPVLTPQYSLHPYRKSSRQLATPERWGDRFFLRDEPLIGRNGQPQKHVHMSNKKMDPAA